MHLIFCDLSDYYMFFSSCNKCWGMLLRLVKEIFYEKYPDPAHWTSSAVNKFVSKAVEKMRLTSHSELRKQLPIADPRHTPIFLEHVKSHYETYDENHEMT